MGATCLTPPSRALTWARSVRRRDKYVTVITDLTPIRDGTGPAGLVDVVEGSALGFRDLMSYIARSLLEAGGFRPRLHPRLR
jgi:hypothetical protein